MGAQRALDAHDASTSSLVGQSSACPGVSACPGGPGASGAPVDELGVSTRRRRPSRKHIELVDPILLARTVSRSSSVPSEKALAQDAARVQLLINSLPIQQTHFHNTPLAQQLQNTPLAQQLQNTPLAQQLHNASPLNQLNNLSLPAADLYSSNENTHFNYQHSNWASSCVTNNGHNFLRILGGNSAAAQNTPSQKGRAKEMPCCRIVNSQVFIDDQLLDMITGGPTAAPSWQLSPPITTVRSDSLSQPELAHDLEYDNLSREQCDATYAEMSLSVRIPQQAELSGARKISRKFSPGFRLLRSQISEPAMDQRSISVVSLTPLTEKRITATKSPAGGRFSRAFQRIAPRKNSRPESPVIPVKETRKEDVPPSESVRLVRLLLQQDVAELRRALNETHSILALTHCLLVLHPSFVPQFSIIS